MQTRTASGAGRPEFTLQHYVRYDPLGFWQEQHTADRARSSALQPFAGPTPPALADSRRLCVSMRWFVNHRIDSARQCHSFLFATPEFVCNPGVKGQQAPNRHWRGAHHKYCCIRAQYQPLIISMTASQNHAAQPPPVETEHIQAGVRFHPSDLPQPRLPPNPRHQEDNEAVILQLHRRSVLAQGCPRIPGYPQESRWSQWYWWILRHSGRCQHQAASCME